MFYWQNWIKAFDPQRSLNRFAHQFFSLFQTHLKTATFFSPFFFCPPKNLLCVWAISQPTVPLQHKAVRSLLTPSFNIHALWFALEKSQKAQPLQLTVLAHSIHLSILLMPPKSSKEDYIPLVKKESSCWWHCYCIALECCFFFKAWLKFASQPHKTQLNSRVLQNFLSLQFH